MPLRNRLVAIGCIAGLICSSGPGVAATATAPDVETGWPSSPGLQTASAFWTALGADSTTPAPVTLAEATVASEQGPIGDPPAARVAVAVPPGLAADTVIEDSPTGLIPALSTVAGRPTPTVSPGARAELQIAGPGAPRPAPAPVKATSGSRSTSATTKTATKSATPGTVRPSRSAASATTATSKVKTIDLYFTAGYERQVDGQSCVAASVSMMVNFIARRDVGLSQRTILRWAQPRDALPDATQLGTDPLGWARAASEFSARAGVPTTYVWQAFPTKAAAIAAAARAIMTTRKPVGILAWAGKHAVVLDGIITTNGKVTGLITSDPYWKGPTVGRHRTWSVGAFPFYPYRERDATAEYTEAWYGRYVIVVPQG